MSILLCVALHLYSGPINAQTSVTEVSRSCKSVQVTAARKAISKCQKQGAEQCEVLMSADKKSIIIENKVQVNK